MKSIQIIVFLGFLLSCRQASHQTDAISEAMTEDQTEVLLTEAQMKSAGVVTGAMEQRTVHHEVSVNGVVDVPPQNIVSISFPMGGYLKSTKLLPGMRIRKGEVIGLMEDQQLIQLQQDYLVTKARLGFLEKEYERQKSLNADKVNADKVYQQATADYISQKVMLKGYAEKLQLIGIQPEKLTEATISRQVPLYSPTNGYVSKVNVNIGKYVQPTDVLFELINPEDIHAALSIFEKDLGRVGIGQKVRISFVDEPEKTYAGEVILVNRNVDENRTAIAHCHFISHPKQLLPGMFLNAKIEVGGGAGYALPEAAIVAYQGKHYVECKPGLFQMREVGIGQTDAGYVEVLRGADSLKDQKIATANAFSLLGALKNVGSD
jgi:membrane fusion protein, heavy metal efflux system